MRTLREKLDFLYGDKADYAYNKINELINKYAAQSLAPSQSFLTEKDVLVETYGDTLKSGCRHPLEVLHTFMKKYTKGDVTNIKLCPHYPFTSDDGYSVSDYYAVNPDMGDWDDVLALSRDFGLLVELVLNHTSKSNPWFKKFLECDEFYKDFYLTGDPSEDHSSVTRPRALPLFTDFETAEGIKHVWTTFSDDQVDLNFRNPDVLIAYIEIVLFYVKMGAKIIGMDAVGFIWKEKGTTCMHLEQTHEIIKLMRLVVEKCAPGTMFITETNVPHKENVSYFGEGDESSLVYQFVLPPLTLHSFLTQNAEKLTQWAQNLEPTPEGTTFYNFLASHDGIGLRPVEGILTDEETLNLVKASEAHGGFVNYRYLSDGSQKAYELNINYMDALSSLEDSDDLRAKRMLAAHAIIIALQGMPSIYMHSLVGSRNWREGVLESGINRRINREKLDCDKVEAEIAAGTIRKTVLEGMCRMLNVRGRHDAFSPVSAQDILSLDNRVFANLRKGSEYILCVTNVSLDEVPCELTFAGKDILTGRDISENYTLAPLETVWVLKA